MILRGIKQAEEMTNKVSEGGWKWVKRGGEGWVEGCKRVKRGGKDGWKGGRVEEGEEGWVEGWKGGRGVRKDGWKGGRG